MSKTLKTTLLAVMLLLGSGKVGYVQDLRKGLEAYNRGDYVTALKELKPLAEQGSAMRVWSPKRRAFGAAL